MALVSEIGDALIKSVKGYVQAAFDAVSKRVDFLEAHVKAIPPAQKGDKGDKGDQGDAGADGNDVDTNLVLKAIGDAVARAVSDIPAPIDGNDGADGADGKDGAPGKDGINGKDGIDGNDGKDGQSAYEIACVNGFVGTQQEWLLSLDGEDGEDGKDADADLVSPLVADEVQKAVSAIPIPKDGDAGMSAYDIAVQAGFVGDKDAWLKSLQGADGLDGKDADADLVLPLIQSEVQKAFDAMPKPMDGKDGMDGKAAEPIHPDTVARMVLEAVSKAVSEIHVKHGENGRDALAIDILPGIDESKSYPRGTYAEYKNGTIRAIRNTDPITDSLEKAGWSVCMNGVADESEEVLDEGRAVKRVTTYTNGKQFIREFKTAMVIDRGVWRIGAYEKGDHVSQEGSGWIAQKDTTDKPGTSDAWRLSTKRGRDGKNFDDPHNPPQQKTVRLK